MSDHRRCTPTPCDFRQIQQKRHRTFPLDGHQNKPRVDSNISIARSDHEPKNLFFRERFEFGDIGSLSKIVAWETRIRNNLREHEAPHEVANLTLESFMAQVARYRESNSSPGTNPRTGVGVSPQVTVTSSRSVPRPFGPPPPPRQPLAASLPAPRVWSSAPVPAEAVRPGRVGLHMPTAPDAPPGASGSPAGTPSMDDANPLFRFAEICAERAPDSRKRPASPGAKRFQEPSILMAPQMPTARAMPPVIMAHPILQYLGGNRGYPSLPKMFAVYGNCLRDLQRVPYPATSAWQMQRQRQRSL